MKVRQRTPSKRHQQVLPTDMRTLQRELKKERIARQGAESKVQTLEWKLADLDREVELLRKGGRATEDYLQKEIRRLNKEVKERDDKLEEANRIIEWFRREFFTSNRETVQAAEDKPATAEEKSTVQSDESDSGAEEVEQPQTEPQQKRKRGQQKGSKGHSRSDRSGLDTDEETLEIPGCACQKCGKPYLKLPTTKTSQLLEIQMSLLLMLYRRCTYVSQCQCQGKKIVTAPPPPKLYPRTNIGNSMWVYLVVQKFLHQVPTNRTLKDLSLSGLPLSPGTVTGGFKIIEGLLEPLYNEVVDHCRGADIWNADESFWRVFGSDKKKWWLWVIASLDAVVYILDPSRSKQVPDRFFAGSVGVLMTDRFSSYKALKEAIRKAWCWVHVRRDFFNTFMGVPVLKNWAQEWLLRIAELFVLEHRRFKLWQDGKDFGPPWQDSVKSLEDHVETLEKHWTEELKEPNLHKRQRSVLNSLKKHWPGLTLFLEDPRIPLHNNRAERLLRNAVVLRKNSYGSGSEWSGKFAAKLLSIFQTWLINGLDPQAMLLAYFDECSKTPGRPPPQISNFLPWAMPEERKKLFLLPKSYKCPG
jgi:transposase